MTPRWLMVALALSVTLNLFLLGFGAARWFHGPHDMHGPGAMRGMPRRGGPLAMRELMRDLPEPRRQALRDTRQQLRGAQTAVRDALTAEPFDRDRLLHAFEQLQRSSSEAQRLMHENMAEIAPRLNADQRARLARAGSMFGGMMRGGHD